MPLDRDSFAAQPEEFAVRWLGHSTLIFELAGVRFITDPVFGNAAPLPRAMQRYTPSPLARKDLPPLDFVLISHDHYDHLEYETIRFFRDRDVPFVVPLGVGARLRGWGIQPERIRELNWDESIVVNGIRITAQTARHFSGRTFRDRNTTLWSAYVLQGGGKSIFFGADGGYGTHFREIGAAFGPFDLICLEIDAWNERWPNTHLFPEEVIQAQQDLGGGPLLPIHWGVFDLAMHPWDESIRQVAGLATRAGAPLFAPRLGEKAIPGETTTLPWWESVP
ncbi:MAG: MBL fold metallo-hydrolase [Lentisphaeria bacterium]|nr:MBL fold metallo-hydrolase [Lentisphaeria bacterium]